MSYYKVCPLCGAHLDPGECCDCAAPSNQQTSGDLQEKEGTNTGEIRREEK